MPPTHRSAEVHKPSSEANASHTAAFALTAGTLLRRLAHRLRGNSSPTIARSLGGRPTVTSEGAPSVGATQRDTVAEINLTVRIPQQTSLTPIVEIVPGEGQPRTNPDAERPHRGATRSHQPSTDMLLMLFNRYDELARADLAVGLGSDADTEIWLDLVEGPAAAYVDLDRSSVSHLTIGLITGDTIRRGTASGSWEVVSHATESGRDLVVAIHELIDAPEGGSNS